MHRFSLLPHYAAYYRLIHDVHCSEPNHQDTTRGFNRGLGWQYTLTCAHRQDFDTLRNFIQLLRLLCFEIYSIFLVVFFALLSNVIHFCSHCDL